jgi:hypothetical protein
MPPPILKNLVSKAIENRYSYMEAPLTVKEPGLHRCIMKGYDPIILDKTDARTKYHI